MRNVSPNAVRWEGAEFLELAEASAGIGVWDVDLATGMVRGRPQFFRLTTMRANTEFSRMARSVGSWGEDGSFATTGARPSATAVSTLILPSANVSRRRFAPPRHAFSASSSLIQSP